MASPNKKEAAFARLHALVRKGYQANLGVESETGYVRLEHPRGASAGAPTLTLCSDGLVIGVDNLRPLNNSAGDPDCIYVADEADWQLFQLFLSGVPEPTTLQSLNALSIWKIKTRIVHTTILCALTAAILLPALWLVRLVMGEQ